jgi:Ser-tRNA(Ala) deacylase AlaX
LNINFVAFVNDKVHHYIKEDLNEDFKEQEVVLKVDQERRLLNSKSHTSGLELFKKKKMLKKWSILRLFRSLACIGS